MLPIKFLTRFVFNGVLLLIALASCKKGKQANQHQPTPFRRNELILVYPAGLPQNERIRFRDSFLSQYVIRDVKTCICDPRIEVVMADNVHQAFGSDSSSYQTQTSSRLGVRGAGDVIASKNLLFRQPVKGLTEKLVRFNFQKLYGGLRIAVIDTGLDTTEGRYFTASSDTNFLLPATAANYRMVGITDMSRIGQSRFFGWNFLTNTPNIMDNNDRKHGTNVTGLILSKIDKTAPGIIPLKAFDAAGESDLFTVRCALKFAELAGAKIINASWGYDGGTDNETLLESLKSLEQNNILVVAAAGNDNNNTDDLPHFPGSFSDTGVRGLSNIITVATATAGDVCRESNYSEHRVDVAVAGTGDDCGFVNVFEVPGGPRITGTSYAAAIVTGTIANQFGNFSFTAPLKESALNHILRGQPAIPALSRKIRTGKRIVQ